MKKLPNPIDIHVGSRIRLRRTVARMSQEQLADGLGVTFQQVQKYEKGTNRVSASKLQLISEILGVPIVFFFENGPNALVDGDGVIARGMNDVIHSKETIALAAAFHSIENPRVRQSILNLVRSLSVAPATSESKDRSDLVLVQ